MTNSDENKESSSLAAVLTRLIVPAFLAVLMLSAFYGYIDKTWPGLNKISPSFSAESLAQAQKGIVCEVVRQPVLYKEFGPSTAGVAYVSGSVAECSKFKGPIVVWTIDQLKAGQNVEVVIATDGKGEGEQYALPRAE